MQQYEQIENYLSNLLSLDEKKAFETELATNTQLAEELAIYKAINATMQQNIESNETLLKETIAPLQQQYFNNNAKVVAMPSNKGKVRKIIFAGLSAAAILVLVFTLVPMGSNKTNTELYAQYAPFEKIENTTRGGTTQNTENKALALYNNKNYKEAIPLLQSLKDSNLQLQMLLGISLLETSDYNNAQIEFASIAKGQSVFVEKANWYIALTYLKQNKIADCKKQLATIKEATSYYEIANKLLKQLK